MLCKVNLNLSNLLLKNNKVYYFVLTVREREPIITTTKQFKKKTKMKNCIFNI